MSFIFRNKEIFGSDFPIRLYTIKQDGHGAPHSHEYMQIWYVKEGFCTHVVDGKEYALAKSNLFVVPPYVVHDVKNRSDDILILGCEFPVEIVTDDYIMNKKYGLNLLDFTFINAFETFITSTKPCKVPTLKSQLQIEWLLEGMLTEFSEKKEFYEISLKADLLKLITFIARDYECNSSLELIRTQYEIYMQNVVDYINDNYSHKLYIKDVSKIAMMSESYFSYFFKKTTGKTFSEYLSTIRIEKAAEMLLSTDDPISDISYNTGFSDVAYFNRVFKKTMGISPAKYRQEKRMIK